MTFNDFRTKVKSLLLFDQDSDDPQVVSYIEALIAEWISDILYYVENYRVGNTDTYLPAAIDTQCEGGRVDLPAELYKLESVAIVKKAEGTGVEGAYIVSGAGTEEANGEWLPLGLIVGGRDEYRVEGAGPGDELILWTSGQWEILDDQGQPGYFIVSDDLTPPETGWTAGQWLEPTPTVTPSFTPGCETVIDLNPLAWNQRDNILNGKHCNKYAIDPRATEIYFFPVPEDNEETGETQWLRVCWSGVKVEYSGEEIVPYAQDAVKCCSDFINWNLSLKKEDKPARANRFEAMFNMGRQRLYKTQLAKSQQR